MNHSILAFKPKRFKNRRPSLLDDIESESSLSRYWMEDVMDANISEQVSGNILKGSISPVKYKGPPKWNLVPNKTLPNTTTCSQTKPQRCNESKKRDGVNTEGKQTDDNEEVKEQSDDEDCGNESKREQIHNSASRRRRRSSTSSLLAFETISKRGQRGSIHNGTHARRGSRSLSLSGGVIGNPYSEVGGGTTLMTVVPGEFGASRSFSRRMSSTKNTAANGTLDSQISGFVNNYYRTLLVLNERMDRLRRISNKYLGHRSIKPEGIDAWRNVIESAAATIQSTQQLTKKLDPSIAVDENMVAAIEGQLAGCSLEEQEGIMYTALRQWITSDGDLQHAFEQFEEAFTNVKASSIALSLLGVTEEDIMENQTTCTELYEKLDDLLRSMQSENTSEQSLSSMIASVSVMQVLLETQKLFPAIQVYQ